MSPSRAAELLSAARGIGAALLALLFAAPLQAAARLEVKGTVASEDEELVVSVQVDNRGDAAALPLTVHGELLGKHDEAQLESGVASQSWTEAQLRFPQDVVERPGVHVVALRLDYQSPKGGAWSSQAAYLLLALGANPPAAVRIFTREATMETRGRIPVELESADGRPHTARVGLITPKGLNAFGEPVELIVPAQGRVGAELEVLRGSVARSTRQGLLVAAVTTDGDSQTAAVAEGAVVVAADPAVMPKLRIPLTVAAVLILLAVTALEVRRRWPRGG